MPLASSGTSGDPGRVAVIGGGVIGCFLAYRLAQEGVPVTVIERKALAAEASGASAGNVQPSTGACGQYQATLGTESLGLFRRYLPAIKEESGVNFGDQEVRYLYAAMDEEEAAQTRDFAGELADAGLRAEWIDAAAARELDSRLSPDLVGGMLHQDCIQMDPALFVNALATAAQRRGARLAMGEAVGLEERGGRVSSVRLADGSTVDSDTVVTSMGAWTGEAFARWLGVPLPVGPHPLQKLHLRPLGPRLGCAVRWKGTNIVHRVDGLVHVGSKHDETGFEARPTAAGREWLLERMRAVLPGLEFEVAEAGAGCAVETPGMLPIMGSVSQMEGVYVAVAGTNGFLLSALIADAVTKLMTGGEPHRLLHEMSPERALARAEEES